VNPAFIFDLDGTLVDTAPDLLGALNGVLADHGRRKVDLADLRHLVGHGARAMLAEAFRMTGEPAPDDRLKGLTDDFIVHYRAHIADASVPFPGVIETLDLLAREGTHMAVLSNKPQELCDQLLAALGMTKYFGAIHGAGRYSYSKPDARVYHHVVEEIGGPQQSLMIGDSATDVATARAAYVPVIVLTYGYTPIPARELGGDRVTDDFRCVPRLARELFGI
jgi:phosphoglycolate phosphatase